MSAFEKIYLVQGKRTPFGKFGGSLKEITPVDLAVSCAKGLISEISLDAKKIDQQLENMKKELERLKQATKDDAAKVIEKMNKEFERKLAEERKKLEEEIVLCTMLPTSGVIF